MGENLALSMAIATVTMGALRTLPPIVTRIVVLGLGWSVFVALLLHPPT